MYAAPPHDNVPPSPPVPGYAKTSIPPKNARDGTTHVIEGVVDAAEIKRWLDEQTGRPK